MKTYDALFNKQLLSLLGFSLLENGAIKTNPTDEMIKMMRQLTKNEFDINKFVLERS
ncbi:hypothetical protein [Vibrio furnissii]|uniref:hypothetical protein n=1 Tax=Vibrio furnissii TaxID=29494 RepID=UPI000200D7FC|nr:hypothetical protein [Vibrio furnissii]ADT88650.1 hypothetical protein vfu_B00412 [Vibrio furnissii NCTC 11218]